LFKKIILSSTNDGGMIKTEKRQIALATWLFSVFWS
jgi:hypothetical protein